MAMVLQALSAKLGTSSPGSISPRPVARIILHLCGWLWLLCELAIIACDLAEVLIGTAIALNLLFSMPLVAGVIVTAADVLLILALSNSRLPPTGSLHRRAAAVIMAALRSGWSGHRSRACRRSARGLFPARDLYVLYVAIDILGATVMPHNLYLHSSIITDPRAFRRTEDQSRRGRQLKLATDRQR